ncbi:MAG: SPOR domain-containing protein [Omnitrophica bacterium]|nr:SPOR domain-containing protein [Candidatus Omnitrophota bacterium]
MKGRQLYLFGFNKDSAENRRKHKVIFHFDTLVLSSVVIILLLTLVFSLGVERGKRIVLAGLREVKKSPAKALDLPEKESQEKIKESEKNSIQFQADVGNDRIIEETDEKKQEKYHIQVASFRQENTAQRAAKILKEKGYSAVVLKKGAYAVIYVGSFDNKEEAKDNLEALREKYKDCILRRL